MEASDRKVRLSIQDMPLPLYTEEEVQILKHLIEEDERGRRGFRGYRFSYFGTLESFNYFANLNLELKHVLLVPFNKIPLLINKNLYALETLPRKNVVLRWRLQIGK